MFLLSKEWKRENKKTNTEKCTKARLYFKEFQWELDRKWGSQGTLGMKLRVQGINRSLNKDVATYSSLLLNNCKLTMYVEVLRKIQEFTTNFKGKNKTHTLPPPQKNPQQQCTLLKFIKCYIQGPTFYLRLGISHRSILPKRQALFLFLKGSSAQYTDWAVCQNLETHKFLSSKLWNLNRKHTYS